MIISFSNQKGGVGKTTTALNLGAFLSEFGLKILLVDFDPQGNLTSGLGITKISTTTYDLLMNMGSLSDAVHKTSLKNLFLIPSNAELSGANIELLTMKERESLLKKILQPLKQKFNIILVDCPPSLGILTLNALCASDQVIIPLQCEFFALDGVVKLIRTINLVKQRFNSKLQILGIVLTMYDSRTNLSLEVAEEIKKVFGTKVYNTIIPRNIRLAEAPSHGLPILLYDKISVGSKSYYKLSEEVLKQWKKENAD